MFFLSVFYVIFRLYRLRPNLTFKITHVLLLLNQRHVIDTKYFQSDMNSFSTIISSKENLSLSHMFTFILKDDICLSFYILLLSTSKFAPNICG